MSENEKNITEDGKLSDEQVDGIAGGLIIGKKKGDDEMPDPSYEELINLRK